MLQLVTTELVIYSKVELPLLFDSDKGSYWLRKIALKYFDDRSTDYFHNHDLVTGISLVRYPLIQYHFINGRFFLVGINEGAGKLVETARKRKEAVYCREHDFYAKIKPCEVVSFEAGFVPAMQQYQIVDYMPLNSDEHKEFKKLVGISDKTLMLENKLKTHLLNDFCKYLNIPAQELVLMITDIDSFNRPVIEVLVNKQKRIFQPFTLAFSVNMNLPSYTCLGAEKVYGFGCIKDLS